MSEAVQGQQFDASSLTLSRALPRLEGLEAKGERMGAARAVKVTLGVSSLIVVAIGALTLTRSPARVLRAVGRPEAVVAATKGDRESCQPNEVLPAGVSALRIALAAYFGARLRVTAYSGSRILTEGTRGGEWTGTSVTVPVKPLSHATSHVKLCVDVGPNSEPLLFLGSKAPAREVAVTPAGQALGGRLAVEDLGAGRGSWWTRALSVARHMGLGHALSGSWIVLLIAALVAAASVLAVAVTLRELR